MIRFAALTVLFILGSALKGQDTPQTNPAVSLEILAATIGDSVQELTNERTSLVPKRMVGKRKISRKWILERKYIEETASTEFPGFSGESRSILTFDKHNSVFRWWTFDTYGISSEFEGSWSPAERTIRWKMARPRSDGYTHSVSERINQDGTLEWDAKGHQRDGTLAVHQTGKTISTK